ncbi:hypothetical protein F4804DRAFT_349496 [Jackrogersella minutella]|nr:hypothetical protein F4804DRAFT_349496 [Jackrogersella minutella]
MARAVLVEVPEGLGAQTMSATIVLGVISIIIVILRVWVRICNGAIGVDDYFMIVALLLFVACCVVTLLGCLAGLGMADNIINEQDPSGEMYEAGLKCFFFFEAIYMICLPFIKTSVCAALLRITKSKRFVIPLWSVIALSFFGGIMGFVSVMNQCKPIAANWIPNFGQCDGTARVGRMAITVSAVSILTDWLCAILPACLLWNLNMKPKVKASLAFILALGALASVSTCVRLPYIHIYNHIYVKPDDGLKRAANLIIWSVVECGIGIIAGSLPPLQPLFRRLGLGVGSTHMKLSYVNNKRHSHLPPGGVAISDYHYQRFSPTTPPPVVTRPIKMRNMSGPSHSNLVTTCEAEIRPWDHSDVLDDTSSQKLIIIKNTRIDIEYDPARPGTGSAK